MKTFALGREGDGIDRFESEGDFAEEVRDRLLQALLAFD